MVGIEETRAKALDAKFASCQANPAGNARQAIGLPEHLADTDLFTFDSADARRSTASSRTRPAIRSGPTTPAKLRYVRVPRGQSIQFDKATQSSTIPPNTRFYKTFMKQIVDTDGSYRYRKIETRLIVSRPDQNNADGSGHADGALRHATSGTTTRRTRPSSRRRSTTGTPSPTPSFTYHTDEPARGRPSSAVSRGPGGSAARGADAAAPLRDPVEPAVRPVPRGQPERSFVLGFTPLQINRRPRRPGRRHRGRRGPTS